VHARAHVAGIDGVDAQRRVLRREDRRELLQRGLRGAVAAPAGVGLDGGVGGEVEDPPALRQARKGELRERERRDHVDAVDVLEHLDGVVGERWLRARPEHARVVDEQVELRARGLDERGAVIGVDDAAADGDDVAELGQLALRGLELASAARVDDDAPALAQQGAGQLESESTGRSGDDGGWHAAEARRAPVPVPIPNWS
jgi:hypothetical protein